MAERLGRIMGRFIMSINDVPEIRSIFSAFDIEDVDLTYAAADGKGKVGLNGPFSGASMNVPLSSLKS